MLNPDDPEVRIAVSLALLKEKIEQTRDKVNDLGHKVDSLKEDDLPKILQEIATLRVKAGIWGGFSGFVISIVSILAILLSN